MAVGIAQICSATPIIVARRDFDFQPTAFEIFDRTIKVRDSKGRVILAGGSRLARIVPFVNEKFHAADMEDRFSLAAMGGFRVQKPLVEISD